MGTSSTAGVDRATVERLSAGLNRCFEMFDADAALFAPDAFFDLLPPLWRFQLRGVDAFCAQLRSIAEGDTSVRLVRVVPTSHGFVMEHEETAHGQDPIVARRLILCEVDDDARISEVVVYCNGGWDSELRARHSAEAPMLRADSKDER